MRLLLLVFLLTLSFCKTDGQTFNDKVATDTIRLPDINFKKILCFNINSIQILVDYNDFELSFEKLWQQYKKGVRSINKRKEIARKENPWYVHRFDFLDSIHTMLSRQIASTDTVYISDYDFKLADIGTGYDFVNAIEKGKCIILDNNKNRHSLILRQNYARQKDWLNGWGGRLYFLQGKNKPFIAGTDWVS